MSESRIPAQLEASGLLRRVQADGGFGTVLAKGDADSGAIMVITCCNAENYQAWERMPLPTGERAWVCVRTADPADPGAFTDYVNRRKLQDGDLWIVELDSPDATRFIGMKGTPG